MSKVRITKAKVYETLTDLVKKLERPIHHADMKAAFRIVEKNESYRVRKNNSSSARLTRALKRLFDDGKISRSEELVRIENYPASPHSSERKSVTSNVYFHAPADYAGKHARFKIEGKEFEIRLVAKGMIKEQDKPTKKEMVRTVLKESDRALTTSEIIKRINERFNAYNVSTRKLYFTALSSLVNGVTMPLRKEGLRGLKLNNTWIWYFTEEQLQKFKEFYVENDPVLKMVKDIFKSQSCVALNRILSEVYLTPEETRYRIRKVAKFIPVKINSASTTGETRIELEVKDHRKDSFIEWLGMIIPKSDSGYGYETMVVNLNSEWEEELKKEIRKSLSRIHIKTVIGSFYEKMVAKLFDMICTSEKLQSSELSRYMIPFVFRDEKVGNVWMTTESGRRVEFDVLLRGTFTAFNVLTDGREFLDIIIPIESKYTMVKPEHVTTFDDKIRKIFGERSNVIPIMIGLSWTAEALHMTKRLGILTTYFSAIDKLIRAMTGTKYRHEHEWKRVELLMEEGTLTIEELRNRLDKKEFSFIFEEYIEKRLSKNPNVQTEAVATEPNMVSLS